MDKNPILEFIERLPFFQEFSDDEKSKLVNTSGIFEKYNWDFVTKEYLEVFQSLVSQRN